MLRKCGKYEKEAQINPVLLFGWSEHLLSHKCKKISVCHNATHVTINMKSLHTKMARSYSHFAYINVHVLSENHVKCYVHRHEVHLANSFRTSRKIFWTIKVNPCFHIHIICNIY